jgi:hypothetical protein
MMKIAILAEMAPAKAFVPIIKQLDADIIGLTHGHGVEEILGKYCTEIHSIGQSRGHGAKKRSNSKIATLVMEDIWRVLKFLRGKNIDLLMTCGNAGDVRKGISAAKILRIPNLHIEQDIYNPIEMLAFSNLVTVPSPEYKEYVMDKYGLKNVHSIGGYPMAVYVDGLVLEDPCTIKTKYSVDEFYLLVLGGDVKGEDVPNIINQVERLNTTVLVVPFRFSESYVKSLIKSPHLKVLEGYVELPGLMKASQGIIYGAGMGLTIEAGVLSTPAIKIAGFHRKHASVDLAHEIGIKVAEIEHISDAVEEISTPNGKTLVSNGENAVKNTINIINHFNELKTSSSGINSFRSIWDARSEFK